MSEVKHTPGPWKYLENRNGSLDLLAKTDVIACQIHIKEANAHLIKAAPDLYSALEVMLGKAYKQNWNDNYPEELEQAQAAIAKANGEQS